MEEIKFRAKRKDNKEAELDKLKGNVCVWQTERPDKPCVFVVENAGDYEIYQLDYVDGRLEWVDNYGYLFDDIEDLNYDKYLIIKWL